MSFSEINKKNKEAIKILDDKTIKDFAEEVRQLTEKLASAYKLHIVGIEKMERIGELKKKYQHTAKLEDDYAMFKRLELMKKYIQLELDIIMGTKTGGNIIH